MKDIEHIVKINGYELLFIDGKSIHVTDKDGYKYKTLVNNIESNKKLNKVNSSNPYVIDNILKFIELNNIKSKPLFDTYKNNSEKLEWKCSCGDVFWTSWNKFSHGKCQCDNCGRRNREMKVHEKQWQNAIDELELDGFIILYFINLKQIHVQDNLGYKYCINYSNYKKGFNPQKFGTSNPYTIDNLNNFFKLERNSEYICLTQYYIGNDKDMEFIHVPCNTKFVSTLSYMTNKINTIGEFSNGCPKCINHRIESYHASILKQIFIHELPDTVCEDRSCINKETNYVLPTDIVNHRLKIVVEIQSAYHDFENKKINDDIKKDFWEGLGYKVYTPDIRDYSVLEMIKLFFPKYNSIPDYIDYNYGNMADCALIQKYLNDGKTILEISKITPYTKSCIQGLISRKLITLPSGYKEKVYRMNKIVQLDKNYNYINTFNSYSDLDKHGYANGTIRRVLNGKQKYSYDCIWMYESEYNKLKTS